MTTLVRRRTRGIWYYVITIATAGLLACVPFFHAASILRRARLWKFGAGYAAASVVAFVLMGVAPTDATGTPTGVLSDIAGFGLLAIIVAACLQQRSLRQQVYARTPHPVIQPDIGTNHAVAAVQAARSKRQQARELATRDPLMARELRIGRPDLPRQYDDGGLIDLNTVPAQVIADVCQLSPSVATTVTDARASLGQFGSVDEALVYANVAGSAADIIKERAIVLPAG